MRRIWICFPLVLALALFCNCSSDDEEEFIPNFPQALTDGANCTAHGIEDAAAMMEAFFEVVAAIQEGEDPLDPPEYANHNCETGFFEAGIDVFAVFEHFEVEVRAGGQASHTDIADDFALVDCLLHPGGQGKEMDPIPLGDPGIEATIELRQDPG